MTLKQLQSMTYEQAESKYRQGVISQAEFDEYCYLWRNSVYRYSTVASDYEVNR